MVLSISLIVILAIIVISLLERLRFPGLIGLVFLGILLGPQGLDLIDATLLNVSGEIRLLALIVILLRAGLGLDRITLKKIGPVALRMSFLPGVFEGFSIMLFAHLLMGLDLVKSGMLGFIIAAVSPAVVVPEMLRLKENNIGKDREVPSTVLAAASVDDVVAITIFSVFLGIDRGQNVNIAAALAGVPLSILLGISIGSIVGFFFAWLFKRFHMRDTKKVLLILSSGFIFHQLEDYLPMASLLGVMAIGFMLRERLPVAADRLARKMERIWVLAEIFLFVLVGASVSIDAIGGSWRTGIIVIVIGLAFRSLGVALSTLRSQLNKRERLFCMVSYIPKATVQAAVGGIPLAMGVAYGDVILSVAVLSILITAPLGAIGIRIAGPRTLRKH
jgi:NhaP-type Na+/H+ or K+/H+ antiporter